ncbi:MAG TPA: GNAT family N-acetyltransferase [Gemmatimonadaceae bacterium]|nr:GNAT family N-acetyltransferase [Gemmatimonadaceae bacterium]
MPDVIDYPSANRFEIHDGDAIAFLSYRMKGDAIEYLHSETPPALQGKGYASAIAKFALEHDKAIGRKVIPTCPFVKTYIQRHPGYASLVLGS